MTHDRDVAERRGFGSLVTLRRSTVIGGTAATLGLNATAMTLNFLVTLALSRMLGVEGYGAYAYAFAWAIALSSAAVLGLSPLVIRNVAAYAAEGSSGPDEGDRAPRQSSGSRKLECDLGNRCSRWLVASAWSVRVAVSVSDRAAARTADRSDEPPPGRDAESRHIVAGRIPEAILAPLLLIVIASVVTATFDDVLTATWAMAIHVFAFAVAFGVGAALLRRTLPDAARSAPESIRNPSLGPKCVAVVHGYRRRRAERATRSDLARDFRRSSGGRGIFGRRSCRDLYQLFLSLAASYPLMPAIARLRARAANVWSYSACCRAARR